LVDFVFGIHYPIVAECDDCLSFGLKPTHEPLKELRLPNVIVIDASEQLVARQLDAFLMV
jgi:hypothetical protein